MKKVAILANDTTYVYKLRLAIIKKLVEKKYKVYIAAEVLEFKEELEQVGCSVIDITIEFLEQNKIKGLILDVDNTLIDYNKNMLVGLDKWIGFCI